MHRQFHLFLVLVSLALTAEGAKLSGSLKPAEVAEIVQVVGFGSVTRVMRSAEAYESWPGFKVGLEVPIVPSRGISEFGDAKGTTGGIVLAPRLYLAKGIFEDCELGLNFSQEDMMNAPGTFGFLAKYVFYKEETTFVNVAGFASFTSIKYAGLDYSGSDYEVGLYMSKDFVRARPYMGVGLLMAQGSVISRKVIGDPSQGEQTIHLFGGAEFEWPINVTVQVDFMNLSPMLSLFFGYRIM